MNDDLVDRIRLGWVVLTEAGPPKADDVTTQPLSGPLLLGLTAGGEPCLLIPVADPGPEQGEGAVTVGNRELETGSGRHTFVMVCCREPSLRDVFDHFLAATVDAVGAATDRHPGAVALGELARWQALFRATRQALGPAELAALLAELLVLAEIVERDPSHSISAWVGPSGARHDFRRAATAIEVKSTLSHTARTASINGVDQLEAPEGGSLALAWYRLEQAEDGPLSVFGVVDRVIAAGASAIELYNRLEQAGSSPSLREAHDAVRFELRESRFFGVADDFPRIVPASFTGGVPDGVDDLRYAISLPPDGAALTPPQVESLLRTLAGGA